jgi:hypothetical protein
MRRWILIALACCHRQAGPEEPATRGEVTPIGNGEYMIRAGAETSEGLAEQRARARANEVCPGGYEVVGRSVGVTRTYERVAIFGRREHDSPEVVLTVRCTVR